MLQTTKPENTEGFNQLNPRYLDKYFDPEAIDTIAIDLDLALTIHSENKRRSISITIIKNSIFSTPGF